MTIIAALAAGLRLLTETLDDPGADVADGLRQLTLDAAAAVSSYLGLSLVLPVRDPPFTISVLADGAVAGDIRTSLHVPLPGLDSGPHPAMALILYAEAPGAFVDLAADLAWLTKRAPTEFTLDAHLAVPAGTDIAGRLQAASDIDQAIGVLISRGYTPEQADSRLDASAGAGAGETDRHAAARAILDTVPDAADGQKSSGPGEAREV